MNEARFRSAERRFWQSIGATPTERRVHLARLGGKVHVQEVGEGPAILFVHGASNSGSSWAELVVRLADFRCIMLDRPGCGLSEPLTTSLDDIRRLNAFADQLVADVLDALEIESASLVATSYGGYLALRTAAAHPNRIHRMVEFGWTLGAPVAHVPFVMRLANVRGLGRVAASIPPNERVVRSMLRQVGLAHAIETGRFTQDAIDLYVCLLRHTDTMRNELAAGPRIITPLRGMNERVLLSDEFLGGIRTPICFLWGEEDPFGDAESVQQFVAQLPNAGLEFMLGAGHAAWIDDPDFAATRTRTFLSG